MYRKFVLLSCLFHLVVSASWATTYHALRPGETLADVAKAYYGDRDRAVLLLQYNRIPDPKKIQSGTKIAIPTVILMRGAPFCGVIRQRINFLSCRVVIV